MRVLVLCRNLLKYVFYLFIVLAFILARRIKIDHVTCLSCHIYVLMNITRQIYSLKWILQQNNVEGKFWSAYYPWLLI